jgi:murein DD-endopeptidase MepM/ murein hydrolase activator NlpD
MLSAFRLGWLAWSRRRTLIGIVIGALALPLVLAAMVVEAQQGGAGGLSSPVRNPTLTQSFGCTGLEIEPSSEECPGHHFHSGVDLAAPLDTPIYAASGGLVSVARQRGGYGLYMIVTRDPRLTTLYGHLDLPLVESGKRVVSGEAIALMGSSGNSTGPHLHFEVRIAGVPVDPLPLLPPLAKGGGR